MKDKTKALLLFVFSWGVVALLALGLLFVLYLQGYFCGRC
jgi:hypothetical protein